MEISKSSVPPVLLRYYKDSGSSQSLSAYIEYHYQIYRQGLLEGAPYLSLAGWMAEFLPETHRKQAGQKKVGHGR